MHLSPTPQWPRLLSVLRQWFCFCWSIVLCTSHCLLEFCVCLCFVMHYFVSILAFAIILKRKRKLVALLLLSYKCIATINVLWLFLNVPWVGLQYVIVVFSDHTHIFCNITIKLTVILEHWRNINFFCFTNCKTIYVLNTYPPLSHDVVWEWNNAMQ